MKQRKTAKLLLLLGLIMSLTFALSFTSQAASNKTKALKAYKKMLSQTTIDRNGWPIKSKNCQFSIAYIDNDNVPELVLYNDQDVPHMGGYGTLFTYRKGKVQFVAEMNLDSSSLAGYYKKKGIYTSYYYQGGESISYNKLSKGASSTVLSQSRRLIGLKMGPWSYRKNITDITKKQFTKQLKKYVGSKKITKFKFYKNTAKNRKKYVY